MENSSVSLEVEEKLQNCSSQSIDSDYLNSYINNLPEIKKETKEFTDLNRIEFQLDNLALNQSKSFNSKNNKSSKLKNYSCKNSNVNSILKNNQDTRSVNFSNVNVPLPDNYKLSFKNQKGNINLINPSFVSTINKDIKDISRENSIRLNNQKYINNEIPYQKNYSSNNFSPYYIQDTNNNYNPYNVVISPNNFSPNSYLHNYTQYNNNTNNYSLNQKNYIFPTSNANNKVLYYNNIPNQIQNNISNSNYSLIYQPNIQNNNFTIPIFKPNYSLTGYYNNYSNYRNNFHLNSNPMNTNTNLYTQENITHQTNNNVNNDNIINNKVNINTLSTNRKNSFLNFRLVELNHNQLLSLILNNKDINKIKEEFLKLNQEDLIITFNKLVNKEEDVLNSNNGFIIFSSTFLKLNHNQQLTYIISVESKFEKIITCHYGYEFIVELINNIQYEDNNQKYEMENAITKLFSIKIDFTLQNNKTVKIVETIIKNFQHSTLFQIVENLIKKFSLFIETTQGISLILTYLSKFQQFEFIASASKQKLNNSVLSLKESISAKNDLLLESLRKDFLGIVNKNLKKLLFEKRSKSIIENLLKLWGVEYCIIIIFELENSLINLITTKYSYYGVKKILRLLGEVSIFIINLNLEKSETNCSKFFSKSF